MNNDSENTDMESELCASGYTMISVGAPYPGAVPSAEGAHLAIGETLNIIVKLDGPTAKEIKAFRSIKAYGFYKEDDLPHGLLLWDFGNAFAAPSETPFNPRLEESSRPDQMKGFLEGRTNACQRILIDEDGIVRAISLLGMDGELIDILRETWANPDLDWSEYDGRYFDLIARKSTAELWKRARKWTVPCSTAVQDQQDVHACDNCKAAQGKVTSLKGALKQAKASENSLHVQITGLKTEIADLQQAKAELGEKLRSLSTESLQQEVAGLKANIYERDCRILDLEVQVEQMVKTAKTMEGDVDDLTRQNKHLTRQNRHLTNLLLKHGTPPEEVFDGGAAVHDKAA